MGGAGIKPHAEPDAYFGGFDLIKCGPGLIPSLMGDLERKQMLGKGIRNFCGRDPIAAHFATEVPHGPG
jgi:hypothetical protein